MKIFLALYIPFFIFGCTEKKEKTSPPAQTLPIIEIVSGPATTFQLFPASIEGAVNVEIRPQVSGTLDKVFADEGDLVSAGQPLFKINDAPYRERLNNAKASLHAAEGTLANTQLEIEKLTPLVEAKVIADYQLRTARSSHQIAMANIEQAQADIASAQINLGYTLIKAPVSGYIGRLQKKQGSLVSPTDLGALTELSDVHEVHVYFALGENDFMGFKTQYPGKTLAEKIKHLPPVSLVMADGNVYSLKGKIELIDGQFDRNTGSITVRASFQNPDGLLRSGNTGKVKLGFDFKNTISVPQSATLEMQDRVFVFLVGKGNKVSKQVIIIAGKTQTHYLVRNGLKEGDKIVSRGFDHLHEGEIIISSKEKQNQSNQVAKN